MQWRTWVLGLAGVHGICACHRGSGSSRTDGGGASTAESVRARVALVVPAEETIPAGPAGDEIRLGRTLAAETFERLPSHAGSSLHCTSCHLGGGTIPSAGPWVGVTSKYPQYRARAGRAITIEERINECFERSINGTALANDSPEMRALVAYMTWLSTSVPKGTEVEGRGFAKLERPVDVDPVSGKQAYEARCAGCHQLDGSGRPNPDGTYGVPPLWGPNSFNIGAGMARLDTAASFVHQNMPLGSTEKPTTCESYDIAAYFTHRARPDFAGKDKDWPRGAKPIDVRY